MFKKLAICLLLGIGISPLLAQVSVLSVVDEDKHTHKEDFWHTFEYYIVAPDGKAGKCQATRIAKNWFATAAHCVFERCAKSCTLRMDLLEQPVSVFISAEHTAQKPIVFAHPSYISTKQLDVGHDIALLHMNLSVLPARYYKRPDGKMRFNQEVSRAYFEQYLREHPVARREFERAIRPKLPPLLVFDQVTRRLNRKLSVVSIFDGKRAILHNPNPSDYVKELGFAYTKNFGVREGMSGSGVMTNTGELAGIISAYLSVTVGGDTADAKQYFMFTVFNEELTTFMESVMGSDYYTMDRRDAYPNYVVRGPQNHTAIVQSVRDINKKK